MQNRLINRDAHARAVTVIRRISAFIHFIFFSSIRILKISADIVLATSTPLTVAVPALLKKWINKTPYVFEVRDVWPEGPIQQGYVKNSYLIMFLRWLEKYIYIHALCVVTLSVGMKRCILSRVDLKNIQVIPNISEISRFADTSRYKYDLIFFDNKKIILYAGTLGPVNNIIYVAKLAEELIKIDPAIIFVVFGDGSQKGEIVKYCQQRNILNRNIYFFNPGSKNLSAPPI
jgi:glycosyltransferase involved in cell wall biosynthesis